MPSSFAWLMSSAGARAGVVGVERGGAEVLLRRNRRPTRASSPARRRASGRRGRARTPFGLPGRLAVAARRARRCAPPRPAARNPLLVASFTARSAAREGRACRAHSLPASLLSARRPSAIPWSANCQSIPFLPRVAFVRNDRSNGARVGCCPSHGRPNRGVPKVSKSRFLFLLCLIASLGLVAAGCGDDEETLGFGQETRRASRPRTARPTSSRRSRPTRSRSRPTTRRSRPTSRTTTRPTARASSPRSPTRSPRSSASPRIRSSGSSSRSTAPTRPGPKDYDFDINQISITPKRAEAVDFSSPYYEAKQAVVALKDSPDRRRHLARRRRRRRHRRSDRDHQPRRRSRP